MTEGGTAEANKKVDDAAKQVSAGQTIDVQAKEKS